MTIAVTRRKSAASQGDEGEVKITRILRLSMI